MQSYKTIEQNSEVELVIKKSRFIGHAAPVSTAESALEFVSQIKSRHWDATHNVFAFSMQDNTQKFSDDGEPQGTAGKPVLNVLESSKVFNAVVVVTRYFGGILLGAGGLIRAYSAAASEAVKNANIITMADCEICSVCMSYNFYGKLLPLLHENGAVVLNTSFEDDVKIDYAIEQINSKLLASRIIDSSNGTAKINHIKNEFMKI